MNRSGRIFDQVKTTSPKKESGSNFNWALPPTGLRFLIIALLVLGVFFRFANIDKKVYWIDETYTSFRVAGYTEQDIIPQVSENKIFKIEELQKYQHVNSEKTVVDTIKGLVIEEPQLTPLYFVTARYWAKLFGDAIASMRSFPAITSLLVFPCVYWLCLELFESSLVGWIAIALIAVSPFHIVYAQEARPYTLWTVTILLSSASLLRAIRVKTKLSWGIYAATVALGLYSFLFFAFVAISHGIYVAIIEGFRRTKAIKAYLVATAAGLFAFLPWIVIVITYLPQIIRATPEQSRSPRHSIFALGKAWVVNISRDFFDLGFRSDTFTQAPSLLKLSTLVILLLSVLLVGYATYFLCRHTPQRVWLFVITLMGVTALALVLPDLILGGLRSVFGRYFVPCYIGIQLAVAYLFSSKISYTPLYLWQQKLWQISLVAVLSAGIISGAVFSQADTWWQKKTNAFNPQLAPIINQTTQPLVMREMPRGTPPHNFFTLVSLSYWLEQKVQYQVVFEGTLPKIPQNFSDVFIIDPSQKLLANLSNDNTIQLQPIKDVKDPLPIFKLIRP
jgi:uncharacterized membrane protein